MDETIRGESSLGQRLEKIKRSEARFIFYQGNKIPIAAKIKIGRAGINDIVIEDNMVSRFHAEIQKIKNAYFIKDLGSTNGTFIDGERIPVNKYFQISLKNKIKIGRTELSMKEC